MKSYNVNKFVMSFKSRHAGCLTKIRVCEPQLDGTIVATSCNKRQGRMKRYRISTAAMYFKSRHAGCLAAAGVCAPQLDGTVLAANCNNRQRRMKMCTTQFPDAEPLKCSNAIWRLNERLCSCFRNRSCVLGHC